MYVESYRSGLQHGTVTAVINHVNFEITTLRIDREHDGWFSKPVYHSPGPGRHAVVEYTTDWMLDAQRRDLTVNAISMDLDGHIYDYFDGIDHLRRQQSVRTCRLTLTLQHCVRW